MDENLDIKQTFEGILKNQENRNCDRKNLNIYNTCNYVQSQGNYSAWSIIANISSQIKAIQNADSVKKDIPIQTEFNKFKNVGFLSLNSMTSAFETPSDICEVVQNEIDANKFETQCVTNTQLINIVEDAEVFAANEKIISQDFNAIDSNVHTDNLKKYNANNVEEDRTTEVINTNEDTNKKCVFKNDFFKEQKNNIFKAFEENKQNQKLIYNITNTNKNNAQLQNEDLKLQLKHNTIKNDDFKTSLSDSLLVVNLEIFERFENLAMPLIEQQLNIEIVKNFIASKTNDEEIPLQIKPIKIDKDKLNIFSNNDENINLATNSTSCILNNIDQGTVKKYLDKNVESIDMDSINQSSKFTCFPEKDNLYGNLKDLPLTCVFETSFNNQEDILDETMYVGFETASNKCIQINRESFTKAQTMLDIDTHNAMATEKCTLTGLVEMCDSTNYENTNIICNKKSYSEEQQKPNDVLFTNYNEESKNCLDKHEENRFKKQHDTKYTENEYTEFGSINKFDQQGVSDRGLFKIPRNQNITISDKSWKRSNIVHDIDISCRNPANNNELPANNLFDKINILDPTTQNQQLSANIKKIGESENILLKINSPLDKIDKDSRIYDTSLLNGTKNFSGFKTASNKKIKIAEQTLTRVKNLFQDILMDDVCVHSENFQPVPKEKTVINIYDDSKENNSSINYVHTFDNNQFKKVLDFSAEAISTSDHKLISCNYSSNKNALRTSTGFKTANNKKVKVSVEALEISGQVFQNMDVDSYINKVEENKMEHNGGTNDLNCLSEFIGFHTASNKKINVSKDALARTKLIFKDIESQQIDCSLSQTAIKPKIIKNELETLHISNESSTHESNKITLGSFKNFKTATNNSSKTSIQALGKCKEMFPDNMNIDDNKIEEANTQTNDTSDEKKALREVDENKVENNYNMTKFIGFHTASNKKINVSKDALAKTKLLFKDIDSIDITDLKSLKKDRSKIHDASQQSVFQSEQQCCGRYQDSHENEDFITKKNDSTISVVKNSIISTDVCVKSSHDFEEMKAVCVTSETSQKNDINLEIAIETQILNDFQDTLCSEDFHTVTTSKSIKRSGSPILVCPKAKKYKFEAPFTSKARELSAIEINDRPIKNSDEGFIFNNTYKKNKVYSLKMMQTKEKTHTKHFEPVFIMSNLKDFEQLSEFIFYGHRNDLTSGILKADNIKNIFLDSVNKKLIPDRWLDNALRLILWKMISYEIKFPNVMKDVCTAKNVIEQLKYRYNRELYNVERPALRKVLEKDETSTRTMILCVVCVYVDGIKVCSIPDNAKNIEILVTDGWYCVKACLDKLLSKMVCQGRIVVGTKIATHGAELLNCEQGIAPWELQDTSAIRLKLSGNSTRRARWDARLGHYRSSAIIIKLSSVNPDGGRVSKLRLYITRVYPTLYIEKLEDGSTVTRSERLETIYQMKYENERQLLLEKLYEEVEKEYADQEIQDPEDMGVVTQRIFFDTESQMVKMMKTIDPDEFKSLLTESQNNLLDQNNMKRREKILFEMQKEFQKRLKEKGLDVGRNVVTLLKVRVTGLEEKDGKVVVTKGLLSVWKPTEAVSDIIKESVWVDVTNVIPTAIRYSEIQLSSGRQSMFKPSTYKESEKIRPFSKSLQRLCYHIKDLVQNPATTTDYNEIDTVGVIFLIDPSIEEYEKNKSQLFQNMFLADADKRIICVNFWGGIKKCGFENMLGVGQIIAGINLQKRAGNTRKTIPQFRVTEFTYFTKTPKSKNAMNMIEELNKKLVGVDIKRFCEECEILKNNAFVRKTNESITPYKLNNADYNISKNKIFIESPLGQNSINKHNVSNKDFESIFEQINFENLSPESLWRKTRLKEKMAKLKMYGEPPPLSPIQITNKSKKVVSSYTSPMLISKTLLTVPKLDNKTPHDTTKENSSVVHKSINSVNMEEKRIPEESPKTTNSETKVPSSPILCENVKTVKRNLNPVKLNFDREDDFDCSLPLSLDPTDCK